MSATELQFRTAAFGGFQKQDVLSYIESANQTHTEKLEGLQRERDELTREKEELEARANQAQEQVQALTQEKEELTAQLDSVRSEMEELRRALEVERASLSQTADQLSQAYQQVKDRTAGIELEAHCRAQEVQQAAEERVRRAHTEVAQWLHKVQAGYDLLRTDMESAVSRTTQDLDKLRQLTEELSSHFSAQDAHLRKLSQDCISDFAPPAPEPLPLDEQ